MSGWWSAAAAALVAAAVLAWPTAIPAQRRLAAAGKPADAAAGPAARAGAAGRGGRSLLRRDRPTPTPGLEPDLVMDLVACGLRAGLSVTDSLAACLDAAGTPYLEAVLGRLRLGLGAEGAWARPPPAYAALARALVLAELSGAPAAAAVSRAATDARAERRERVEIAAARLGVRLVLPLGLAVLPGFVLLAVVPVVVGLATSVLRAGGS